MCTVHRGKKGKGLKKKKDAFCVITFFLSASLWLLNNTTYSVAFSPE